MVDVGRVRWPRPLPLGGRSAGIRRAHKVRAREALVWCVAWMTLALSFAAVMWWYLDTTGGRDVANEKTLEFVAGYLIELSLSVDNMFVFLMIFRYFVVPAEYQRRVLLYGVLGAIAMRAVMILLGVWLVAKFSWILYLFGLLVLVTGIKMLIFAEHKPDLERNPVLGWLRRHLRVTASFQQERFFTIKEGIRYATPLFLVLVLIETSDLVFAVDSIPAIFAVTTDPFIVVTSNIFAIMGLRALYFLLADMEGRFVLLKYGVALVLVFVGVKLLAANWFHVPIIVSLAVVGTILFVSVMLSMWRSGVVKRAEIEKA